MELVVVISFISSLEVRKGLEPLSLKQLRCKSPRLSFDAIVCNSVTFYAIAPFYQMHVLDARFREQFCTRTRACLHDVSFPIYILPLKFHPNSSDGVSESFHWTEGLRKPRRLPEV